MGTRLRDLKSIITTMVSPVEDCITPPPEPPTPEDISPLEPRSTLERHHSSPQHSSDQNAHEPNVTSPLKKRKNITRRNTEPAVAPRLNTTNPCRPSLSLDLIFTPRPLEVILAERAYLVSSLHRQSMQSRQLIVEYSVFEQQLYAPNVHGKARRRLRKKLGHLRVQLDQAAGQEKTIFVRMGEVYTELQSHAAWSEAALWRIPLQQQHQQQELTSEQPDGYFQGYAFEPEEPCYGTQNTPLDPTLPVFIPGQPIYATSDSSSAVRFTSDLSSSSALETVDETSEDECSLDHGDEEEEAGDDCVYDYKSESGDTGLRCKRRTSCDEGLLSPREKRLSLPCLQSIWPDE